MKKCILLIVVGVVSWYISIACMGDDHGKWLQQQDVECRKWMQEYRKRKSREMYQQVQIETLENFKKENRTLEENLEEEILKSEDARKERNKEKERSKFDKYSHKMVNK